MKQLELRNGDLVVGPGGHGMVRGARRIQQDLGAAVRETIGTDRFHPRWGTILQDYVGGVQSAEATMLIRSEVERVVQNYIVIQTEQITSDIAAGLRPRYSPDEIIADVSRVEVQQRYDQVNIRVTIRTLQGDDVTILRSVGV